MCAEETVGNVVYDMKQMATYTAHMLLMWPTYAAYVATYAAYGFICIAGLSRGTTCPNIGDKLDVPALVRPYGPNKADAVRPPEFTVVDVREITEPEVIETVACIVARGGGGGIQAYLTCVVGCRQLMNFWSALTMVRDAAVSPV